MNKYFTLAYNVYAVHSFLKMAIVAVCISILLFSCSHRNADIGIDEKANQKNNENLMLLTTEANVQDYGATGNDTTSDTRAFQQAIDFVAANGGGTVNVPAGEYYINVDTSISMKNNTTLNMVDTTRKLIATATDNGRHYTIRIFNVSNVKILGGKIIGERYKHLGTTGEHGMGIGIYGSNHIVVSCTRIFDCWGDGISVGSQPLYSATAPSTYVSLYRVVCNNNRRQGLTIANVDSVTVSECTFSFQNGTAPQTGIDIEPDISNTAQNISIKNCVIGKNVKEGILLYSVGNRYIHNVRIENNTIYENDYWAGNIIGDNVKHNISNIYFANNTFKDNILVTEGSANGQNGNKVRKAGLCDSCTITPNVAIITP